LKSNKPTFVGGTQKLEIQLLRLLCVSRIRSFLIRLKIPYRMVYFSEGEVMYQTDQDQMTEREYKAKFEFIDATLIQ
jgi:hypothetical protein